MKGQSTNDFGYECSSDCTKGARTKSVIPNGVMVGEVQNGKDLTHHDKVKSLNGCVAHCCREVMPCLNGVMTEDCSLKTETVLSSTDDGEGHLLYSETLKVAPDDSSMPEAILSDQRTHPKVYHLPNGLKDGVMVQELVNRVQEMQLSASCASIGLPPALRLRSWDCPPDIKLVGYESERQMPDVMRLIQRDLSEPYSVYTYRYFIHNWPHLCFLALDNSECCVGAVVCKLDMHKKSIRRGYIAMLAVDEQHRKKRIGSSLVLKAIHAMIADDADEVVLETEVTNRPALQLYENLGFVRDKRLFRYYLNGVDALRLKLWLR